MKSPAPAFLLAMLLVACEASDSEPPPSTSEATTVQADAPAPVVRPIETRAAPAVDLLERVSLLGASATAGFGASLAPDAPEDPFLGIVGLGQVFEAALAEPARTTVAQHGNAMFFSSPLRFGPALAAQTRRDDPTLVVAVDFLFWFGYGSDNVRGGPLRDESERLEKLDAGLALLDRFDCPILVGDFPDMSAAVGKMLGRSQMPALETLAALTARVRAWADERPRVSIVPLAQFLDDLRADRELRVDDFVWPAGSTRMLLLPDELHPTVRGQIALVQLVAAALAARDPGVPPDRFDLEPDRVIERLRAHAIRRRETP